MEKGIEQENDNVAVCSEQIAAFYIVFFRKRHYNISCKIILEANDSA